MTLKPAVREEGQSPRPKAVNVCGFTTYAHGGSHIRASFGEFGCGGFTDYNTPSARSVCGILLIALGNALLHDICAIRTTSAAAGRLFPAALFVGGGSFGVVTGQYLASAAWFAKEYLYIGIAGICILSFFLYSDKEFAPRLDLHKEYNLTKEDASYICIIFVAFFVTFVRSYAGYLIPISWKKEVWQTFLLFFIMGAGKAIGGLLADRIGARETGIAATVLAIPFLLFGENVMTVSVIGVFLYSLTMSITFGMFLSVMDNSGIAFGMTTIALFCGVLPIFANIHISERPGIIGLSILCSFLFARTLRSRREIRKEKKA